MTVEDSTAEAVARLVKPYLWDGRFESMLSKMKAFRTPEMVQQSVDKRRADAVEQARTYVEATLQVQRRIDGTTDAHCNQHDQEETP